MSSVRLQHVSLRQTLAPIAISVMLASRAPLIEAHGNPPQSAQNGCRSRELGTDPTRLSAGMRAFADRIAQETPELPRRFERLNGELFRRFSYNGNMRYPLSAEDSFDRGEGSCTEYALIVSTILGYWASNTTGSQGRPFAIGAVLLDLNPTDILHIAVYAIHDGRRYLFLFPDELVITPANSPFPYQFITNVRTDQVCSFFYYNIGDLLSETRPRESLPYFRHAIEIFDSYGVVHLRYGTALLQMGLSLEAFHQAAVAITLTDYSRSDANATRELFIRSAESAITSGRRQRCSVVREAYQSIDPSAFDGSQAGRMTVILDRCSSSR